MRHRGVQVGNFFLAEKQTGPEFTADDEEVLVLFAAQAAAAVESAVLHGFDEIGARLGPVSIRVNSAAIRPEEPLETTAVAAGEVTGQMGGKAG